MSSSKYARALIELDVARIVDRLIRARADAAAEVREGRLHPTSAGMGGHDLVVVGRAHAEVARREAIDELVGLVEKEVTV